MINPLAQRAVIKAGLSLLYSLLLYHNSYSCIGAAFCNLARLGVNATECIEHTIIHSQFCLPTLGLAVADFCDVPGLSARFR